MRGCYVSVRTEDSKEQTDAIKALEHAAGYIKHELVERLQLRRVPDLHFTLDLSQEHVERIEQLLKQMKAERTEKSEPGRSGIKQDRRLKAVRFGRRLLQVRRQEAHLAT